MMQSAVSAAASPPGSYGMEVVASVADLYGVICPGVTVALQHEGGDVHPVHGHTKCDSGRG
jgi:hypothetical protein